MMSGPPHQRPELAGGQDGPVPEEPKGALRGKSCSGVIEVKRHKVPLGGRREWEVMRRLEVRLWVCSCRLCSKDLQEWEVTRQPKVRLWVCSCRLCSNSL